MAIKNRLHIAASPLSGTIFVGKVLRDGMTWGANKKDLTIEALVAVAEHAIRFKDKTGEDIEIRTADGELQYTIKVERA